MVLAELPREYKRCPFCGSSAVLFVLQHKYFQGEMAVEGAQFPKLNRIIINFKR